MISAILRDFMSFQIDFFSLQIQFNVVESFQSEQ